MARTPMTGIRVEIKTDRIRRDAWIYDFDGDKSQAEVFIATVLGMVEVNLRKSGLRPWRPGRMELEIRNG